MNQIEFRKKLSEINNNPKFSRHPEFINELRDIYPHGIHIYSDPNIFDSTTDCFDFVFGHKIPINIQKKMKKLGQDDPDRLRQAISDFIAKGGIELHEQQQDEDKVVAYFKAGAIKHFAKIDNNTIISKWGRGHAWEHGLWEVPYTYGDQAKYSTGELSIELFGEI